MATRGTVRVSRTFYAELAALEAQARRDAVLVGAFGIEALDGEELDVLAEWAIPGASDCFAFELPSDRLMTVSTAREVHANMIRFERIGGPEVLLTPRAD
jgi:hypothetical protein